VDPRAGLDAAEKKEIPAPAGNRTPAIEPVPTELYTPYYNSEL